MDLPEEVSKLSFVLSRLPGVGSKLAAKIAVFLTLNKLGVSTELSSAIEEAVKNIHGCKICGNLTRNSECKICQNIQRDSAVVMIVDDVASLQAFELSGDYSGVYHVLGGVISPMNGVTPQDLNIDTLFLRLKSGNITELILALDPDLEGDATGMYIKNEALNINPGLKITKLAMGIPAGANLEYLSGKTLAESLKQRVVME